MAEARQKEMNVNITVVATKTFMAGLEPSTDVAMLQKSARPQMGISLEDSTAKAGSSAAQASVRDLAQAFFFILCPSSSELIIERGPAYLFAERGKYG